MMAQKVQTGNLMGNWADEMDALDPVDPARSGNEQGYGVQSSNTMTIRDQIPWDVLFVGRLPQGYSKQQIRHAFHDLQVLHVLELVWDATLYGYYIEFGSQEDFITAFEQTKARVLPEAENEKVPYSYYVEYRQNISKQPRQNVQERSNYSLDKSEHQKIQQQQERPKQEQSKDPQKKSNPFGAAKPVDTASKLLEIEARQRKEMLTKENVEAAAAKASVAAYSLTPRSSHYPTREQWNEQVSAAQLAAAQAIDGRPSTSHGRVTPPANGHLLISDDFDDRGSHYSYNSNRSFSSRAGSHGRRGGRGRGRGGRPMRSGVFDGPPPARQSYSRPESRNSNVAEPRYNRDDEVMSQTSHMSGRSNFSRNGDIAIIDRSSRPPIPSSSTNVRGRGRGGAQFSTTTRPLAGSRADEVDRWRRD